MSEFEKDYDFSEEAGTVTEDIGEGPDVTKKKRKKNKKQKNGGKKGDSKVVVILIALAVAFIAWVVLIVIQDRVVNATITSPVVVAVTDVPEGLELTQANMATYFTVEQRPVEQIPTSVTTYQSGAPMVGLVTDRVIRAKEVVTADSFYVENFLDEVENGVEISIDLSSLGQSVAGTLQAGDFVNIRSIIQMKDESLMNTGNLYGEEEEYPGGLLDITPIEEERDAEEGNVLDFTEGANAATNLANFDLTYGVTGEYVVQNVADKVRVTKVYNSGGESAETVAANGGVMVATIIKVVVPQDKATAILLGLTEGEIYVEKVLDPDYVEPTAVPELEMNEPAVEVEPEAVPEVTEAPAPEVTMVGEYNDVDREDGVVVFTREDGVIIRVDTATGQVLHAMPEEKAEDGFITFSGMEGDGFMGVAHEGVTDDEKKVKVDENGVLYTWDEEAEDWKSSEE